MGSWRILLAIFVLCTRNTVALPPSPVTVYGLGAAEGNVLTETGSVSRSTAVGSDGVVTIIADGATDEFPDHGTFDAVWEESSNGVVFHATGANYQEFMTCTVDRSANQAVCSFSNQVGKSTFSGTFPPTAIPVLATITAGTETPSSSVSVKPTSSAPSSSSSSVPATPASSTPSSALPTVTPSSNLPTISVTPTLPTLSVSPTDLPQPVSSQPSSASTVHNSVKATTIIGLFSLVFAALF